MSYLWDMENNNTTTAGETMTFEYTYYNRIDRDDWSKGTIQALTKEGAINRINRKLHLTGMNLKRSSVKLVKP